MGIVQVKIQKESPSIGSSTSLTEERKKSPFRVEWWIQSTGIPVSLSWEQNLYCKILLRKKSFA